MSAIGGVVRRPVATWMVAIALAVFGLVSYGRLPLNLMPDLAYPTLTVRTEVEGYAPEEVESQVSRPIEEALATTPGLQELESRSRAGQSDVVMEFAWGTDMNAVTQTARERLQTTMLPKDAGRPLILRYDPSQEPILRLGLVFRPEAEVPNGLSAEARLREIAERRIKRELEALDGIAAVRVRGGLEREVRVEAQESWLAARGVTIDQLTQVLGAENINLPGGSIRDGEREYLVRTLNEVRTVAEIEGLQIRRADGVRVPVSEVAKVEESTKEREVESRLDGKIAVELEIFKAADANIVTVAADLLARLDQSQMQGGTPLLPDDVELVVLENQAQFIEASIANLRSTAIEGAVLAIIILFLFLRNFRATAIIAAAIPLSIVATFAPMYLGGVSLNLMSLGGLALGIGMLVDNAVVVLENIQVKLDAGKDRATAAIEGTAEVAAAVTASTLTTVAVFLPIAFVEGVAGQIFGDLALAVVFSLSASLIVAIYFVPVLAASEFSLPTERPPIRGIAKSLQFASIQTFREGWRARSGGRRATWLPWATIRLLIRLFFETIAAIFVISSGGGLRGLAWAIGLAGRPLATAALWAADRFESVYQRFAIRYSGTLASSLKRPGLTIGIVVALFLVSLPLGAGLSQSLIPELHQGRFVAMVGLPVGTPLGRTAELVQQIEAQLQNEPGIAHLHVIIGSEQGADAKAEEGEHTARLMVELEPTEDVQAEEERLMERVRTVVANAAADLQIPMPPELRLSRPSLFSFSTPVEVLLYDDDLSRLRQVSARVVEDLSEVSELSDLRSSMVAGYPELQLRYDRLLLEKFGLDSGAIAGRIRDKVQGATATSLSRGDGRVDLVVRLAESDRRSREELERINVNPNLVPPIPLASVATILEAEGPSEIRRIDQRRAVAVTANLAGFDMAGAALDIRKILQRSALDGVEWEIGGQNREMERSMNSLQLALLLAIFLVYVIMASTFESIVHPFVILVSVPLAIIGVIFGLFLTGTSLSVVVLLGCIVLAGVVVNNAIVLVDTVNRLRAEGLSRREALHRGSTLRLRPILITTSTTLLGLIPLALGIGEGAEVQQPLALTIIVGLGSSTFLTLGVIPAVYLLVTRALEQADGEAADAVPTPDPNPAPEA